MRHITQAEEGQYNWNGSYKTYHYFKYEPIKWRVLNRNGNDALLLADVALDDQKYNTDYAKVTWETSSMLKLAERLGASVNSKTVTAERTLQFCFHVYAKKRLKQPML